MRLALIFLLVISSSFAQSPDQKKVDAPPAHAEQKDGGAQKAAETLKPQSAPIPPTVNVVASGEVKLVAQPPKDDGSKGGDKGHENIKFIVDVVLAGATVGLFVATLLLYLATKGLVSEAQKQFPEFKKNVKAATDSAIAAKESANAAVDSVKTTKDILERAYIIGGPGGRRVKPMLGAVNVETHICVTMQNYGRTVGFVKEVFYGLCLEVEWPNIEHEWPKISNLRKLGREDVLYPDQKHSELRAIDETALPIEAGKTYVSYGRIVFHDVFGKEHSSAWKHRVVQHETAQHIWVTPTIEGCYTKGWD